MTSAAPWAKPGCRCCWILFVFFILALGVNSLPRTTHLSPTVGAKKPVNASKEGLLKTQLWFRVGDINQTVVSDSIVLATKYLVADCNSGRFAYIRNALSPKVAAPSDGKYNWVRHAGAIYALTLSQQWSPKLFSPDMMKTTLEAAAYIKSKAFGPVDPNLMPSRMPLVEAHKAAVARKNKEHAAMKKRRAKHRKQEAKAKKRQRQEGKLKHAARKAASKGPKALAAVRRKAEHAQENRAKAVAKSTLKKAKQAAKRAHATPKPTKAPQWPDMHVPGPLIGVWSSPSTTQTVPEPTVKLGAVALTLTALLSLDRSHPGATPLGTLQALARFLVLMQRFDGSFHTTFPNTTEHGQVSVYYPGEAALALTLMYERDQNPLWLGAAGRSLTYIMKQQKGKKVIDHWGIIATAHFLQHVQHISPEFRPFVASKAELTKHAVGMAHNILSSVYPHHVRSALGGSFLKGGMTTPTAIRMEGLLNVLGLLDKTDRATKSKIKSVLHVGLAFLLRTMIRKGPLIGGITKALPCDSKHRSNANVRIDYVQHALTALVRYHSIIFYTKPKASQHAKLAHPPKAHVKPIHAAVAHGLLVDDHAIPHVPAPPTLPHFPATPKLADSAVGLKRGRNVESARRSAGKARSAEQEAALTKKMKTLPVGAKAADARSAHTKTIHTTVKGGPAGPFVGAAPTHKTVSGTSHTPPQVAQTVASLGAAATGQEDSPAGPVGNSGVGQPTAIHLSTKPSRPPPPLKAPPADVGGR